MAITYVNSSEIQDGDSTDSAITLPLPTGWAEGDLVIVSTMKDRAWGEWSTTHTGWTLLENRTETVGRRRSLAVFYKVMTDSETDPVFNYSHTGGQAMSMIATAYRGNFDQLSVINVYATDTEENTMLPVSPSITTTVDNCAVLLIQNQTLDDITGPGAPTGYTMAESIYSLLRPNRQQFHAYKLDVGAAGLKTFTAWTHETTDTTASDSATWSIAIAEEAASSTEYNESLTFALKGAVNEGHHIVIDGGVALRGGVSMAFEQTRNLSIGVNIVAYTGLQTLSNNITNASISCQTASSLSTANGLLYSEESLMAGGSAFTHDALIEKSDEVAFGIGSGFTYNSSVEKAAAITVEVGSGAEGSLGNVELVNVTFDSGSGITASSLNLMELQVSFDNVSGFTQSNNAIQGIGVTFATRNLVEATGSGWQRESLIGYGSWGAEAASSLNDWTEESGLTESNWNEED